MDVEVVARYAKVNKPAIVECAVGDGVALLCGVHPEYSVPFLDRTQPHIAPLWEELERSEEGRRRLFRDFLSRLTR